MFGRLFSAVSELRKIDKFLQDEREFGYYPAQGGSASTAIKVILTIKRLKHEKNKLQREVDRLKERYEKRPYAGARDLRGPFKHSSPPVPVAAPTARDTRSYDEPTSPAWYPSVERDNPPPAPSPKITSGGGGNFGGGGADGSWDAPPAPQVSAAVAAGLGMAVASGALSPEPAPAPEPESYDYGSSSSDSSSDSSSSSTTD